MSSEEKDIAPSRRKLREARRRGQAKQLRDLTTLAAFLAGAGGLLIVVPATSETFGRALDLAFASLASPPARQEGALVTASAITAAARSGIAPVLGAVLGGIVLAVALVSIVAHGGIIFSFAPMSPKPTALDPVAGLKRIFGLRSVIEFSKSIVKLLVAAAAFAYVAATFPGALVRLPECGLSCAAALGVVLVQIVVGAALLLSIAFAVPDLRLQAWLFERDMRMTKSEQKQEMKDSNGNPQVKSAQKRLHREAAQGGETRGPQASTVMVFGRGCAVGIRYVKGETRVPLVVAKSRDADHARTLLDQAIALGVRVYDNEKLTKRLVGSGKVGQAVHPTLFGEVAAALSASGAIAAAQADA